MKQNSQQTKDRRLIPHVHKGYLQKPTNDIIRIMKTEYLPCKIGNNAKMAVLNFC